MQMAQLKLLFSIFVNCGNTSPSKVYLICSAAKLPILTWGNKTATKALTLQFLYVFAQPEAE